MRINILKYFKTLSGTGKGEFPTTATSLDVCSSHVESQWLLHRNIFV